MDRATEAGELAARRLRATIGRTPPDETGAEPQPWQDEDWPPEELLALHDRHDVSHLELRSPSRLFGRLVTRLRLTLLRPVLDLAGRQSEVNALTARVLSELANRTEELRVAQAERLNAEQAVRTLRQRVATLESTLAELRRRDERGRR